MPRPRLVSSLLAGRRTRELFTPGAWRLPARCRPRPPCLLELVVTPGTGGVMPGPRQSRMPLQRRA